MILDDFRLDGKIALVTGGTKGLGRAMALGLAQAGADLALVSRSPNPELAAEIESLGRRCFHHVADLTEREQIKGVIPAVAGEMGGLDILVNDAGINRRYPVTEFPEEEWSRVLEIQLNATFLLSQAAARIMLEKGRGKIINIASVLSFQGGLYVPAYTAAKHAVVGLTKSFANDLASKGINVNAIAPGWYATELTAAVKDDPARYKSILDRIPAGRWGDPSELAGAVVFLASKASDYVHGTVLAVDGGWLSW